MWGEGVTERVVWHVIKEFANKDWCVQSGAPRFPATLCAALPCCWRRTGIDLVPPGEYHSTDHGTLSRLQAEDSVGGKRPPYTRSNSSLSDARVIEELFLATLGRYPAGSEVDLALQAMKGNRIAGAENLAWALLNKIDFLYNY